jgi:hypothetical protein
MLDTSAPVTMRFWVLLVRLTTDTTKQLPSVEQQAISFI